MRIPVSLRKDPDGRLQAVGVISVAHLAEHYKIDYRNSRTKTGYQRPLSATRVNKLAARLRKGRVDLPTAILLNIRDFNPADLIAEDSIHWLDLKDYVLWVVDGQHRTVALEKVYEEYPERWANYLLPIVVVLGASSSEELDQFYEVNSNAKSVQVDLSYQLLSDKAKESQDAANELVERGEYWKVVSQALTERLAELPAWKGRVRHVEEPPAATTIKSGAMVKSLKPLVDNPYFAHVSTDSQIAILRAYWEAISRLLPEAFEAPTDYVVQKTAGASVLHDLLVTVLEIQRSRGSSVIDSGSYENILAEPLEHLEGTNVEGETVSGVDFWRVGAAGGAAGFSNNAGMKILASKLRSYLPEVEVE
jgi:DGQHR domain-containing protein